MNKRKDNKSAIETIAHAAIIADNGMIFLGMSHECCFTQCFNVGLNPLSFAHAQGFFTNLGRYVTREEAADIAYNAGQILKKQSCLISEDIWSEEAENKHEYTNALGYFQDVPF